MRRGAARACPRQQEGLVVGARQHRHRADRLAHPPPSDHLLGNPRDGLQIGLRARRHVAVDDLLGGPATEGPHDATSQVVGVVAVPIGRRRLEGHAQRPTTRDDRDLSHRIRSRLEHAEQCVTGLMVGRTLAFFLAEHDLALGTQQNLLQRICEVRQLDPLVVTPRRHQGSLVGQVLEVRADHAGRGRGEAFQVDVVRKRHVTRVDLENREPTGLIRRVHCDAPVEATRAQQRGVQDLGTVGCCQHDDTLGPAEPVHLGQDLVERLLALLVATHGAAAT